MSEDVSAWQWTPETLAALATFLEQRGITAGPVSSTPIGDGHSNLTYLVTDGTVRVVVRRPPPPPVPPGAHDMLREARFMHALGGTAVPVPRVLATAAAGDVLDVPLYVMSAVDGPVVTTLTPSPLDTPEARRSICESMIDTLADLHSVDWRSVGLADAGRPEGFNARHLRRMAALVAAPDGSPPAEFAGIQLWLTEHTPAESGAAIVHNDFRLGNLVLAPDAPGRVAAVLDWELATIGDPLFDLGYFLASVPESPNELTPTEEFATAMLEPGYLCRDELAARYAERSGRDLTDLAWYSTLALWKLAVLYEYGRRRAERGVGDDYYAGRSQVESFLRAAHQTAGIHIP
ncbi:phosphotransferase [Subtercola boreus]|uniref:Phosphotransferase n=1 Tax=Subtercola boreus TaxID=120213 RepID=A0A3E0VNJ5_9MICO|nr:phosphotransferase family protein [Subtercola boreus]RFA10457.1 phosphotransferase [Subtercola boreus]TQL56012.1 aminoglycoside phosphotransferase (APT) family kinase protein [Subtercola boreus]